MADSGSIDTKLHQSWRAANPHNPQDRGSAFEYAGASFSEGVRDFIRDVPWAITWAAADSWRTGSGDQQYSPKVAQAIEDFWDKYIKTNTGSGEFEFRMGIGWDLPKGMPYNGDPNPKNEDGTPRTKVDAFTAVFLKNRDGTMEVLDSDDPRWDNVVGPYMVTQIGTIAATMGGGAIVNGMSKGGTVAKVGATGLRGAGITEAAGSIGILGTSLADGLVLKDWAIEDIGQLFIDPSKLTTEELHKKLNKVLKQYSHDEGSMTEQYYVPSLKDDASARDIWGRLEQLSRSRVEGFRREHPFEEIADKTPGNTTQYNKAIPIRDLDDRLKENPDFQKGFQSAAIKALSGTSLTHETTAALRFSMNILYRDDSSLGTGRFDSAERMDTMLRLRTYVSMEMEERRLEREMRKGGATDAQISQSIGKAGVQVYTEVMEQGNTQALYSDKQIMDYLKNPASLDAVPRPAGLTPTAPLMAP